MEASRAPCRNSCTFTRGCTQTHTRPSFSDSTLQTTQLARFSFLAPPPQPQRIHLRNASFTPLLLTLKLPSGVTVSTVQWCSEEKNSQKTASRVHVCYCFLPNVVFFCLFFSVAEPFLRNALWDLSSTSMIITND